MNQPKEENVVRNKAKYGRIMANNSCLAIPFKCERTKIKESKITLIAERGSLLF